jgi:S1-C subfamily serine protease
MALIPPFSFNCVVALGIRDENRFIHWSGTGTLIGRLFKKTSPADGRYHVFIVTNKHILQGQSGLVVRFNPLADDPARDYDIPLLDKTGAPRWSEHPCKTLDVAVLGIDADFLAQENIRYEFFQSDNHLMTLKEMAASGVSEGDFVYALGFPMGIVDSDRQYVIARAGCIARIRDALEGHRQDFLIDAFIFPGNSGGPVLYKPEIISIGATQPVSKPGLLGIVSSYLSFKDTAVSRQTGHTRVVFEENSGLAVVVPIDFILETIESCFARMDIKEKNGLAPT